MMKKLLTLTAFAIVTVTTLYAHTGDTASFVPAKTRHTVTAADISLPAGFSATVIATGLDGSRHIAIAPNGGIYIKLGWLKNGKGICYLKDTNGDGIPDEQTMFGDFPGTGIAVKNGWLYASSNSAVYRYKLNDKDEVVNTIPEKIVTGLVDRNRDNAKEFVLDNNGNIYVVVGSYVNACLVDDKSLKAPMPCPLLDSVGGVWKFSAGKQNQTYSNAVHYATGFKNMVGMCWNTATNSLFAMQHGRDMLNKLFPQYYTPQQEGLLPAETMYELHQGSNGGWPYVYYDPFTHKKILSPEYGGDGKKTGGKNAQNPVVSFPAHLAPDDLLFYTGNTFPAKYKNGAFIAFHGKSPQLNKGYLIAFVPFKNGKPSGEWEIFADGFGGKDYATNGKAPQHKPCGLAQGPDGAIYVTDDIGGTIFRIQYDK
ncbi:MAG TPA: PQQ-dependent sugar dehydrogenase [Chitinophagaceae bacterium]|nr:PQQ-dependent sugar dehydrogenase [Chitinophagaceae bacterium]